MKYGEDVVVQIFIEILYNFCTDPTKIFNTLRSEARKSNAIEQIKFSRGVW